MHQMHLTCEVACCTVSLDGWLGPALRRTSVGDPYVSGEVAMLRKQSRRALELQSHLHAHAHQFPCHLVFRRWYIPASYHSTYPRDSLSLLRFTVPWFGSLRLYSAGTER